MDIKKPKILSLFSGCGGLDLGFVQEGYNVIWANDNDHWSCETLKLNFKDCIVVESDVADIDFNEVPDCDVINGGFPCQDFSIIWKRKGIETDRGNLYKHFVRAIKIKNPKIFIAENVKGLLTANSGKAIKQVIDDFQNLNGKSYRLYINIFNFANYGVPQIRERVIIVGIRKDIPYRFNKPKPSNNKNNYVTAGEALKGVDEVKYNNEKIKIKKRTEKIISLIKEGGNFSDIPKDNQYYVNGMISHVYRRLDRNKPSTTIIAAGGGGTWGYHYEEARPLTNRERARLFSFPDDFVFMGNIAQVRRQIGNSVPPKGSQAIAKELLNLFNGKYVENNDLQLIEGDALKYIYKENLNQLKLIEKL